MRASTSDGSIFSALAIVLLGACSSRIAASFRRHASRGHHRRRRPRRADRRRCCSDTPRTIRAPAPPRVVRKLLAHARSRCCSSRSSMRIGLQRPHHAEVDVAAEASRAPRRCPAGSSSPARSADESTICRATSQMIAAPRRRSSACIRRSRFRGASRPRPETRPPSVGEHAASGLLRVRRPDAIARHDASERLNSPKTRSAECPSRSDRHRALDARRARVSPRHRDIVATRSR